MSEKIKKDSSEKKMKKGSRLFRSLKKLLCCCWCKAKQQSVEEEAYVVADRPCQDEGHTASVCEEKSSQMAGSSSETTLSLQVACGQSPERESIQSAPEENIALEEKEEEEKAYVVADRPCQDEGHTASVCEEAGSLMTDSSSETTLSRQVICGQSPERESVQSSPEENMALEDPVHQSGKSLSDEECVVDEALIASIYALIEEPLKPSATEALKDVEEQGKVEGETGRRAARRRRRRKRKKAQHEEEGDTGEWQVVSRKRKRKKNATITHEKETIATKPPSDPEPQSVSQKQRKPRRDKKRPQDDRDKVRLSWQESTVQVAVPVQPNRRRHVIGTRGEIISELQQQYPAVRVSVPPPQDLASREVMIEGPKTQADAVALQITQRLQKIEEKLQEAKQLRQERKRVVLKVEVAPDMRRHVVGPGGETLRRLTQEHPAVRVSVPAPSDTQTDTVTIRGPRNEATVVAEHIKACVQAAGQRQRQRQRQPNKRK